jgi:thiosulfate dehydrogenase
MNQSHKKRSKTMTTTLQKLLITHTLALLCTAAFAAPDAPAPVNLVGRAVPEIDKLPPGQYRELVQ